jgi:predicted transcriptional regulator
MLDEESTSELVEAMAECDRGEVVSADEVFAALPPRE